MGPIVQERETIIDLQSWFRNALISSILLALVDKESCGKQRYNISDGSDEQKDE